MHITEENKLRWLPKVDKPGTLDEHLESLGLINEGKDYGAVMSYDPELAKEFELQMQTNAAR